MKLTYLSVVALSLLVLGGCSKRETRVESGTRDQVLHLGNGDQIEDVDPQVVTGVTEHNVIAALFEGLLSEDPKTRQLAPAVAERWEVSPDQVHYKFYLRQNAKWSNGDPITATDFVRSYQRILSPGLGSEYANMLFPIKNAEAFFRGEIKNFDEVGVKALDDRTLEITLRSPTPYLLSMIANHYSWYPVHIPTIEKFGKIDQRGTAWTKPGNLVGNGAFILTDWRVNDIIIVKKNPLYWDAATVKLNEIRFYPIQSLDTEERAFRSGQLHVTYECPRNKVQSYQQSHPHLIRIAPYLGSYFYRINTTRKPFDDKRVRQALAMTIDRESLTKNISRAGEIPALTYVPPASSPLYKSPAGISPNVEAAKKLLAEAGYPDGKGLKVEIHFNTQENHRKIAEAIQEMWVKNLGAQVTLVNHEWKVYLDAQDTLNYDVSRAGWIADFIDPNAFLELFVTGGGNNDTGWSNKEFDKLIEQAAFTAEPENRMQTLQRAETILLEEMPLIPIYFYTKPYLIDPSVKEWNPNVMGHTVYKYVYLESDKK